MRQRGFEKISKFEAIEFNMPTRKTKLSAGYDFCLPEETILPPNKIILVPTGVKAYMLEDEYLGMHIRSSIAIKKGISLVNNEGIIDADYYNNADNEGHIMLALLNNGTEPLILAKGERIAQGIFYKYLVADGDDIEMKATRIGGFGSTK